MKISFWSTYIENRDKLMKQVGKDDFLFEEFERQSMPGKMNVIHVLETDYGPIRFKIVFNKKDWTSLKRKII